MILVGTEQALRRTDDGFGEAGLRVHGLSSLRARGVCRPDVMTIAEPAALGCEIHHIAATERFKVKIASDACP